LLIALLPGLAFAEAIPRGGPNDNRVRLATYQEGQVYRLHNMRLARLTLVSTGVALSLLAVPAFAERNLVPMAEGDGGRARARPALEQAPARRRSRATRDPGMGPAAVGLRVGGACLGRAVGSRPARHPDPARRQTRQRPGLAEPVSPDEWQAHVTTEAALAMGRWLEARGRLDRPIASLTRRDLECMASNAISRFIVLSSERRTAAPDKEERDALDLLLMG
tara:strand:- start:2242 stop:2907 length:666 start_codon:yes stop_codon:yes gene_type:complete